MPVAIDAGDIMNEYDIQVRDTFPMELFQAVDAVMSTGHIASGRRQTVSATVEAESHDEAIELVEAEGFEVV